MISWVHRIVLALALFSITVHSFTPQFPYGSQPVRGVNLGGWLVLERWITPSLFKTDPKIIDEWTYGQYKTTASVSALQNHWKTFIVEDDFKQIAAAGLNHVRIPIGYWAFQVTTGEPFIQGSLTYLNLAIGWARKYGLKVIIDLHGAPGSQNGFSESGRRVKDPTWHTNKNNVARTQAVIKMMANMYKNQADVVSMIAPLNEPAGWLNGLLAVARQFWNDSYGDIRYPFGTAQQSNIVSLISDCFQDLSYWKGFQSYPSFEGVAMDNHHYQIFSDAQIAQTRQQHIQQACGTKAKYNGYQTNWLFIGEWTAASTDCAISKKLNPWNDGARYDGTHPGSPAVGNCTASITGKGEKFSAETKTFLSQFWEAQATTFEKNANGWIFWTWKHETSDEWSYKAGLQYGWIPNFKTGGFKNPNICG
ncbi:exo-beta-1,3-glucanase [Mycena rebaudengoi]|nr:exo-beta-1,3-glucanase [Mycena rebaudengoi]